MAGSKPIFVSELRILLTRAALSMPGGRQRARDISNELRATLTTIELYMTAAAAIALALEAEQAALDRHDISSAMQEAALCQELEHLANTHLGARFQR
jgi:hypothetical protein